MNTKLRLTAAEFGEWVSAYDHAGIDLAGKPSHDVIVRAASCALVVCSAYPRSLESAKALGISNVYISSDMFREVEMPHASWRFPRLSPAIWAIIFRLMWALGYARGVESLRGARHRARRCAEQLATLASEHGTVLFVGHGLLNSLISKHLKRMGWSGPLRAPRKYWEYCVYKIEYSVAASETASTVRV